MNSRDNFFKACGHKEPEKIPYVLFLYGGLIKQLEDECGCDYRDFYQEDVRLIPVDYPEYSSIKLEDNYFPLPTKAAAEKAKAEVYAAKERGLVTCNSYTPGIFEHAKAFTNDEFALTNMMLEPEDMKIKIGRITDWLCRLYEIYAGAGYDICFNGDDIGTQKSTIMGIDSYREFYKPNHKKLLDSIKAVNPDTKVAFHCCGYMHSIIPEWIDVGIDIVHSVQPEANDLVYLKESFGDKITYWGALGLQSEMFYMSLDEIAEQTLKTLRIMAKGGGFIAATSNYVTDEVAVEKIKVTYKVLQDYSRYDKLYL